MRKVNIAHYAFIGVLLFLSVVTIGLSANVLANWGSLAAIPVYLPLDLAVAILTLVVVVPSTIINFFRHGAFTSMVIVEIAWTSVLKILWVAAAGQTTAFIQFLPSTCDYVGYTVNGDAVSNPVLGSYCRQEQALAGMAWLAWLSIFAWLVTLLTLASIAHSRGNPSVWKQSVTDADFTKRVPAVGKLETADYSNYSSGPAMQQQNTGYSPQQQYPPHPAAQPMQQFPGGYNASPQVNMYVQPGTAQV